MMDPNQAYHGFQLPKPMDAKLAKISILAIASIAVFSACWWLMNLAFHANKNLDFWIWPVLLMSLAVCTLSFFSLVNSNKLVSNFLNISIFVTYVFFMPKDFFVFIGGILFFLLSMWFEKRIRAEERARADFSIRRVLASSMPVIIYGLLLMLGSNIYANTSIDFRSNPQAFYEQLGKSTAAGVKKVDLNQTLDQFLTNQGVDDENETLSAIIASSFTARIKKAAQPYERFFPLIFTLILLALLRSFAFLFRWVTIFITWVLFRILLSVKFFKIEKVAVEVSKLTT